jgi:hypothetical protein
MDYLLAPIEAISFFAKKDKAKAGIGIAKMRKPFALDFYNLSLT